MPEHLWIQLVEKIREDSLCFAGNMELLFRYGATIKGGEEVSEEKI